MRRTSVAEEGLRRTSVAEEGLRRTSVAEEGLRRTSVAEEGLRRTSVGGLVVGLHRTEVRSCHTGGRVCVGRVRWTGVGGQLGLGGLRSTGVVLHGRAPGQAERAAGCSGSTSLS